MTNPISGNQPQLPSPFYWYDTNQDNKLSIKEITARKKTLSTFAGDFFKADTAVTDAILNKMDANERAEFFATLKQTCQNEPDKNLKNKYADTIFKLAVYEITSMKTKVSNVRDLVINILKFMNKNMQSSEIVNGATQRDKGEWNGKQILAEGNFNGCTEAAKLFFDLLKECLNKTGLKAKICYVNSFQEDWALSLFLMPYKPEIPKMKGKSDKVCAEEMRKWKQETDNNLEKKLKELRKKKNEEKNPEKIKVFEKQIDEIDKLKRALLTTIGHFVIEVNDGTSTFLVDPTGVTGNFDDMKKVTEEEMLRKDNNKIGVVRQFPSSNLDIRIFKKNDRFYAVHYPFRAVDNEELEIIEKNCNFPTIEEVNAYLQTIKFEKLFYKEKGAKNQKYGYFTLGEGGLRYNIFRKESDFLYPLKSNDARLNVGEETYVSALKWLNKISLKITSAKADDFSNLRYLYKNFDRIKKAYDSMKNIYAINNISFDDCKIPALENPEITLQKLEKAIFKSAVSQIKQMRINEENKTKGLVLNIIKFMGKNMRGAGGLDGRNPCEWSAKQILASGTTNGCVESAKLFQELFNAAKSDIKSGITTKYRSSFHLDWAISCREKKKENPNIPDINLWKDTSGHAVIEVIDGGSSFLVNPQLIPPNEAVSFKDLEQKDLILKELPLDTQNNKSKYTYYIMGGKDYVFFDNENKADVCPFPDADGPKGSSTITRQRAQEITDKNPDLDIYLKSVHPAFEEFDKNNDGRISKEEILQNGDKVAEKFLQLDKLTRKFLQTVFNRMHLDADAKKEFLKNLLNIYNRTTNPEEKKLCSDALFELAVYQIKQMDGSNEVNGLIINIIKFMCQNAIARDTEADKCARSSQEILASGEVNGCYEAAKLFSDLLRRINPDIENYFVCAFDENIAIDKNLAEERLSTIKDRPKMSGLTIDQQKEKVRNWIEERGWMKVGGHVVMEIRNPRTNNAKESIFLVDPSGFRNIDKSIEKNENISFEKLEDRHIIKYEQKPIIHMEKHKNIEKPKYGVLESRGDENIIYAKSKNALYINEYDMRIDHIRKALIWLECLEGQGNYEPDYIEYKPAYIEPNTTGKLSTI